MTNEQIIAIFKDPRPSRAIAAKYNTTKTCILGIKNRKNYKKITEGLDPVMFSNLLSKDQVVAIYKDTRSSRTIAEDYDTNKTTINKIKARELYSEYTEGLGGAHIANNRKLTKEQEYYIKNSTEKTSELAKQLGVSRNTINRIRPIN